jgi:hypothetical protein
MTELDFISTSPLEYGGNVNANLLISSSVVNPGVDNTPIAPFELVGMTLPFQDENEVQLVSALKEIEELRFNFTGGVITTKIVTRKRQNGYFYLRLEPLVFDTLPPTIETLAIGTPAEQDIYRFNDSEFIFKPFFELSFANNDFNPLMNSSNDNKPNAVRQVVDRTSDAANPTNLQAILALTAQPAQLQNCSYTKAGIVNARYDGTKLTSGSVEGNDPALAFKEFDGSIHLLDSDNTTITGIDDNKRDIKTVYFNPILTGSHPNKHEQNFPELTSILYQEEDKRFVRISNKKVFIVETGTILTMSEVGKVTLVE